MKKILLTGVSLLVVIIGGVYLIQRHAPVPVTLDVATTTATSTQDGTASGRGGTVTIPEEGEVALRLGESAAFKGIMITPLDVAEDSRCPAGVYCIQAGTVKVILEISSGLSRSTTTVKLGDSATVGSSKITFTKVDPLKTKTEIDPNQYVFTIKVEKAAVSDAAGCYVGGCSGEICSDTPNAVSSCIYSPQYACYKSATCERQASGQCGWTQTDALTQCLANAS